MMTPVEFRVGSFDYGWFSNEGNEPPHVHVFRGSDRSASAKFWLTAEGAKLEHNKAHFSSKELKEIAKVVNMNRYRLTTKWFDFFSR